MYQDSLAASGTAEVEEYLRATLELQEEAFVAEVSQYPWKVAVVCGGCTRTRFADRTPPAPKLIYAEVLPIYLCFFIFPSIYHSSKNIKKQIFTNTGEPKNHDILYDAVPGDHHTL